MTEIISTQPTSTGGFDELPPSYDEAEEARKREEEERKRQEELNLNMADETIEDCCCYVERGDDALGCLWLLSQICRSIAECTNGCFECLASCCHDCCDDKGGDNTSVGSIGGCCDCDCDCSD